MVDRAEGQAWWANLPDPLGWHPVPILTRDDALPKLHHATVAPLTRTVREIDSEVVREPCDGVPTRGALTLDNIARFDQDLLVHYLTTLASDRLNEVWEAAHYAFDMPFRSPESPLSRWSIDKSGWRGRDPDRAPLRVDRSTRHRGECPG
jgi:mRNA interferase MazF